MNPSLVLQAFNLDRSRNRRDEIFWALCVPDSCTPEDVEYALDAELQRLHSASDMDVSVSIDRNMCQTAKPESTSWLGTGQFLVG